jgi:hypothetical protein
MDETENKSTAVRRLLAAGRELSDEQRSQLHRLRALSDELWERREGNQAASAGKPKQGASASQP